MGLERIAILLAAGLLVVARDAAKDELRSGIKRILRRQNAIAKLILANRETLMEIEERLLQVLLALGEIDKKEAPAYEP